MVPSMGPSLIRNKLLKISYLSRLSSKRFKAFEILLFLSILLFCLSIFLVEIDQLPFVFLFYGLSSVSIMFAFLLLVPKEVLIRYTKEGFSYKGFAIGTLLLMGIDIGGRFLFLYFTGGTTSLGLHGEAGWLLFITLSGPMLEELIFRLGIIGGLSWLVNWLVKKCNSSWYVPKVLTWFWVVISAVTFGLFHMFDIIERTPQAIVLITFGGVIYGVGYMKYGLASSIIAHGMYNFVNALL